MSSSTNHGAQNGQTGSKLGTYEPDQKAPAFTDSEQLLRRRSAAIEELYRAYKAEFLAVIEDLYGQYQDFAQETGRSGWREEFSEQRVTKPPLTAGLLDEVRKAAEGQGGTAPPPALSTASLRQLQSTDEKPDRGLISNGAAKVLKELLFDHLTVGLPHITELEGRPDLDSPIPRFGQLEKFILSHKPNIAGPSIPSNVQSIINKNLSAIARLECLASSATARKLDNAIAVLIGEKGRYLISRPAVSLGRGGAPSGNADVDLSLEGAGVKVSRQQAHLWIDADGKFYLKCMGRRSMFVDGQQVIQGTVVELGHLSFLEVGTVRLLFMINQMAVDRMVEATKNRLNT